MDQELSKIEKDILGLFLIDENEAFINAKTAYYELNVSNLDFSGIINILMKKGYVAKSKINVDAENYILTDKGYSKLSSLS